MEDWKNPIKGESGKEYSFEDFMTMSKEQLAELLMRALHAGEQMSETIKRYEKEILELGKAAHVIDL